MAQESHRTQRSVGSQTTLSEWNLAEEVQPIEKVRPPDGGLAWIVVFGGAISFTLVATVGGNISLLYRFMLERFGESAEATAWVVSIHFGTRFFSAPICGAFINKVGFRFANVVAGVLMATGLVVCSVGPTLMYSLCGLGILTGLGSSIATMVIFSIPGTYFDKNKGKATSILTSTAWLIAAALVYLTTYFWNEYGYSGMMLLLGGLMLHISALAGLYAPLKTFATHKENVDMNLVGTKIKQHTDVTEDGYIHSTGPDGNHTTDCTPTKQSEGSIAGSAAQNKTNDIRTDCRDDKAGVPLGTQNDPSSRALSKTYIRKEQNTAARICVSSAKKYFNLELVKEPNFLLLALFVIIFHFSAITAGTFVVDMGKEKGLTNEEVTLMYTLQGMAAVVSRFFIGFLMDNSFIQKYQPYFLALNGILYSLALVIVPSSSGMIFYTTITCVQRGMGSALHTQYLVVMVDTVGAKRMVSANAIIRVFIGIGVVAGPAMGGAIKDAFGSNVMTYYVASGAQAGIAAIYGCAHGYLRRERKQRPRDRSHSVTVE